jgi:hypothetical protein
VWLGYERGALQVFRDGRLSIVKPESAPQPMDLTQAVVLFGKSTGRFTVRLRENQKLFLLGLQPSAKYEIEVDDEEVRESRTDAGGILSLNLAPEVSVGVRLRPVSTAAVASPTQ